MPTEKPEDLESIQRVLELLATKWTLPVLNELCQGPARFNALMRANPRVTQKALTQCLRRLEVNGLITRTVITASPLAVVYQVSALGASLEPVTKGILQWSKDHVNQLTMARASSAENRAYASRDRRLTCGSGAG